jgi:hypothetical protein
MSALPSSFTTANIMKLHQGMNSDEILQLFGEPKNISSAVCGIDPNQWTCTTWECGRRENAQSQAGGNCRGLLRYEGYRSEITGIKHPCSLAFIVEKRLLFTGLNVVQRIRIKG